MSKTYKNRAKKNQALAVALEHNLNDDRPPYIVASGRGNIAEQILQIAFASGVKVREDADLAQLLTSIDIESEIPIEAIATIAEILTYVYRANATDLNTKDSESNITPDGGLSKLWQNENK